MSAELIARLEAAPRGAAALDELIAKLHDPTDDPRMAAFENGRDYPDLYTRSLDAALALTQKLGFTSWTIEPDAAWVKWVEDGDLKQTHHVHFHGTAQGNRPGPVYRGAEGVGGTGGEMSRVRVKDAEAMLFDWRVPPLTALNAYQHARGRRFGDVTTHFMLHCAGVCRVAAEENAAIAQWESDGGA